MVTRTLSSLVAVILLLSTVPDAQQRIRVSTHTVPIYATVIDRDRRLVTDLDEDDFEIYDNGRLQTITTFVRDVTPLTVAVMLDTSGSMTLYLDLVKRAAEQFVIRMLPHDKAKVGAFNDKIQLLPKDEPFTSDRDRLLSYVDGHLGFGNSTRLWDAIDASVAALEPYDGRRTVLVFTDGDDTGSRLNSGAVLQRAREQDIMVYGIGLHTEYMIGQKTVRSRPDRRLKGLVEETGGGYFELTKADDLGPTFTRVAQELQSQYVLGFSPETLDGKVHKLEVRVKRTGMTVRGRKSYLAAPPTAVEEGSDLDF